MMVAQQRQVVGRRLTAMDPMLQMMPIEIPLAMTTGKRAATIARVERSAQRRRQGSLLAPDIERFAVLILDDRDEAAGAEQPLHRLDRQIRTPRPSAEGFRVGVQDDLIAIRRRPALAAVTA